MCKSCRSRRMLQISGASKLYITPCVPSSGNCTKTKSIRVPFSVVVRFSSKVQIFCVNLKDAVGNLEYSIGSERSINVLGIISRSSETIIELRVLVNIELQYSLMARKLRAGLHGSLWTFIGSRQRRYWLAYNQQRPVDPTNWRRSARVVASRCFRNRAWTYNFERIVF